MTPSNAAPTVRRLAAIPVLAVLAAIVPLGAAASATATAAGPPPPVVPNAGQSDPSVRFEARASGGAVYFTPREVVLAQVPGAVRLRFDGARSRPALRPVGRQPGVVNDLRGGAARWRTGLPTYAGVGYQGLYPGIDVRHEVDGRPAGPWVRTSYRIAPRADLERLRWRYEGATALRVDSETGEIRVRVAGRPAVAQAAPTAWQQVAGRRVPVDVRYTAAADGSVGLRVGAHDRRRMLLVAPVAARGTQTGRPGLRYSTFLGGRGWDEAYDVDVDPGGGAYVTGLTFSSEFPRAGARRSAFGGAYDAFVARISPQGTLLYSTYLGGGQNDVGHNIAVDRRGNAYITGRTRSADFPVRGAMQPKVRGRGCQGVRCDDAFVTKLSRRGTIAYSTYLGGEASEDGWGIAVDRRGSAYVTGNTDSRDFPTRDAAQPTNRSRPCRGDLPCPLEVFVTKLTPSGRRMAYSTYLGGARSDTSGGIAVDRGGSAYVTGTTRSSDFPTRNARARTIGGRSCGPPPGVPCLDVFVTKLSSSGRSLRYSTYLGGTQNERSGGIAVDGRGRAYVTGSTTSTDFPTARAVQPAIANATCEPPGIEEVCADAFVSGLSAAGRRLRFSTYLGGNAEDRGLGIAVDRRGGIHVAGSTDSRQFRTRNPLQATLGGGIDGFVATLAPGGRALRDSTYLGGRENERINAIAVDQQGAAVLAGRSDSPDFPTTTAFQDTLAGDFDAFVTKLR